MEKRVISTQLQEEDYKIESSLRPQRLEDYIGQEKIKSNMKVYIEAAKARQEARHPGNRVAGPDSELPLVSVRQLLWSLVW